MGSAASCMLGWIESSETFDESADLSWLATCVTALPKDT